jgi:hypothetical protein
MELRSDLVGKFADEIDPKNPFEFFTAQASVTIEANTPILFTDTAALDGRRNVGGARLLLPLWGNGRIEMMLYQVLLIGTDVPTGIVRWT